MGKIKIFAKSSDLNYPDIKPTLNLNFAANKTLDPRITYSRNSIGTYVGSDGYIKTAVANEPRFDHDPTTGRCLGLLVEPSRTNYLYPSTPESSGSWSNQGAPLIPNAGIAPDGTNTAVLTAWNTVSGSERIYYDTGTPVYVGVTEIHSFFIKSAVYGSMFTATFQGVNWSWINGGSSTRGFTFDIDRESLSANTGLISEYGAKVIKYNNGWYRICIPAINNGTGAFNTYVAFNRANQVGNWYIWGCQREVGTYLTSCIPTSGSTVTRQADVVEMTGTNFSSWYNTSEGSLVSIGEENSHKISSNTLTINSNSSSKNVVPNILYYPKTIQYPTLKTMNAYSSQVTDGLVLQLDAGLKKSYVGVGTFWNDLSGNGNTGTLVNGVGYNSDNGGSLVFDGVNDYNDLTDFSLGSQITLSCWIKTNTTSFSQLIARGNTENTRGVYLSINRTAGLLTAGGNNTSGWNSKDISNTTINDNRWHYVVGVYNQSSNNVTGYVDGNVGITQTVTFDTDNYTPKNTKLARNQVPGVAGDIQWYNGNIAQVSIYNRALSAAEVQQNFNALRGRFGL